MQTAGQSLEDTNGDPGDASLGRKTDGSSDLIAGLHRSSMTPIERHRREVTRNVRLLEQASADRNETLRRLKQQRRAEGSAMIPRLAQSRGRGRPPRISSVQAMPSHDQMRSHMPGRAGGLRLPLGTHHGPAL